MKPADKVKLCTECKHMFRGYGEYGASYKCRLTVRDRVSGEPVERAVWRVWDACETERGASGGCGPNGKNWEPRLFTKLLRFFSRKRP